MDESIDMVTRIIPPTEMWFGEEVPPTAIVTETSIPITTEGSIILVTET